MTWQSTNAPRRASSMVLALALSGVLAAPGRAQEPGKDATSPAVPGPEAVVQEQVEAYNRHDIEAFLKTYSSAIKAYDFPDTLRFSGLEAMRERYGKVFQSEPDLKVKIAKRIVQGNHVIDHEEIHRGDGRPRTAVVIYRVEGGKITAVWFVR
jgi:hypothetical protein